MPNGIIIVNKPAGWTSHDVVAKLRGIFHERRIGHAGTLDPMATGVLPVFVGRATRAVEFMETATKAYDAGLLLGLTTDTQDTTGEELERKPVTVTRADVENVLPRFRGQISQIPPMYSAVKIGGQKLYQIARKGGEVERKPRQVEIFALDLLSGDGSEYMLHIDCSKGVYVRTICADIGDALDCGGCMSSLVRTRAGEYTLDDAFTMEEIIAHGEAGTAESLLRSVDTLFDYPKLTVSEKNEKKCRNGNAFSANVEDGNYRVYAKDGTFLMAGRAEKGKMYTIKSFFEV
ncbi:MAG: tRNA pseudouridine(55) synthase TruB [Ruminococcaceae bacterium]|nr:tRNA pseudouridine(55) synthase TruB [Oscillospiraceae bacterium]